MDQKIPTWRTDISLEVLGDLKEKFEKVEMWQKSLDTINNNIRNHNSSGIDYSNDFEKVMDRLNRAQADFYADFNQIKAVMGETYSSEKQK